MIILYFSYRAVFSGELNCTVSDRRLNSLSNDIGLGRRHDQARPQIQPFFPKKRIFRPKFMVFLKNFFAQNYQRRLFYRNRASKIKLDVHSRN